MEQSNWWNSRTIVLGLIGMAIVAGVVVGGRALGVSDEMVIAVMEWIGGIVLGMITLNKAGKIAGKLTNGSTPEPAAEVEPPAQVDAGAGVAGATLAILAMVTLSACSVQQAQRSTQITLTTTAEALDLADQIVREAGRQPVEDAVDHVLAICSERECSREERLELLRAELASWYAATEGLEVSAAALHTLQAALDTWVATGDLPGDWGPLCVSLGRDLEAAVGLLVAAGVEVPPQLGRSGGLVAGACGLVVDLVGGENEKEASYAH